MQTYINYELCNLGDLIMNMQSCFLGVFKTIFQVQLYWLIVLCFLSDALSPRRPEWTCIGFLSVTNEQSVQAHFWVQFYTEICPPADQKKLNKCTRPSPVSLTNGQNHLANTTALTHRTLPPSRCSVSQETTNMQSHQCQWRTAFSSSLSE